MRDSHELNDFRPDRNVTRFTASWVLWVVGFVVVLGILGWVIRWASVPGQVISPENVRKQWAFAYQYDESLQAAARQVCATEKATNIATDPQEKTQRRSQQLDLENNYARIEAEFNARLRNAFEAKLVAPNDVPSAALDLSAMKARVCAN